MPESVCSAIAGEKDENNLTEWGDARSCEPFKSIQLGLRRWCLLKCARPSRCAIVGVVVFIAVVVVVGVDDDNGNDACGCEVLWCRGVVTFMSLTR